MEQLKIASKILNEEQERTLNSLLDLIIPPSKDEKMPGAADVGFLNYICNNNLDSWIKNGLISIIKRSLEEFNQEFSTLSISEQIQLIEELRSILSQFFNQLANHVIQCYYQNDRVLNAIGVEARPPFPEGYHVEEGDYTMLEPVYDQKKIYREVDDKGGLDALTE